MPAQERAEQAGIPGGHGMIAACRYQLPGNGGEMPDRQMHVAHRPEVIDERGVRAALLIGLGDVRPAVLAVQELLERDAAFGVGVEAKITQAIRQKRPGLLAQPGVQVVQAGDGALLALRGFRGRRVRWRKKIMRLEVHEIFGEGVFHGPIVLRPASEKDDSKAVVRQPLDELIDP